MGVLISSIALDISIPILTLISRFSEGRSDTNTELDC